MKRFSIIVILALVATFGTLIAADYDYNNLPTDLKVKYLEKKATDPDKAATFLEAKMDSLNLIQAKADLAAELEQAKKELENKWAKTLRPMPVDSCITWAKNDAKKAAFLSDRWVKMGLISTSVTYSSMFEQDMKTAVKAQKNLRDEIAAKTAPLVARINALENAPVDETARIDAANAMDRIATLEKEFQEQVAKTNARLVDAEQSIDALETDVHGLEIRVLQLEEAGYAKSRADRRTAREQIQQRVQ